MLGRHHCKKLPFIRDVQGIKPKKFAGAAHGMADRNFFLEENYAVAAVTCQFVEGSSDAAASGIAHPADACAGFAHERLHEWKHGSRVGPQLSLEVEISPGQQYGDAMISNRAGEKNLVTRPHGVR